LTNKYVYSTGTVLNTQTRTTEYGNLGQPSKVTDTFGNVTIYSRDGNARITQEEYWENSGTVDAPNLALKTANEYAYDSNGNMTLKTEALSASVTRTTTYQYY
jgi:YD repeat-containing protein